jgi:hypothetical protein
MAWWQKGMSLCYVYNYGCAFRTATVTLLLSLALGRAVAMLGTMSDEVIQLSVTWVPVISLLIIFFFGQEFLPDLRRRAFLDRACICQNDEKLKQQGIHNLGAYLLGSRRFVMLWNGDYFKSLWCVWEAALFMKIVRLYPKKSIEITPTFFIIFQVLGFAAACGFVLIGDIVRGVGALDSVMSAFGSQPECLERYTWLILSCIGLPVCILFSIFLARLRYVEGLASIEGQIKEFKWKSARCFLEADRERLGRQVADLHGSIEAFEELMRTDFLDDCMKHLGGSLIPFSYGKVLFILFPIICAGAARLALAKDSSTALFVGLSYSLICFVGIPWHFWSAKKCYELLWPDLQGAFIERHRLAVSILIPILFTLQGILVVCFGLRLLTYNFVATVDPDFVRPDTLTPYLGYR